VEILGHIFEQSKSDLEQLHQEIAKRAEAEPAKAGPFREMVTELPLPGVNSGGNGSWHSGGSCFF
jgi:hypothetical protein